MANHHDEYSKRERKRRRKKGLKRLLVLFVSVVAILILAWLTTSIIQRTGTKPAQSNNSVASSDFIPSSPESLSSSAVSAVSVASAATENPSSTAPVPETPLLPVETISWNFVGPIQQDPASMQIFEPDYRMFAVPENGRIDMQFFNTVTFIGDSITQGLFIYPSSGFPNAKYCAYLGASPKSIYDGSVLNRHKNLGGGTEVPLEALVASQPDNVYILMGTNALVNRNLTDEDFIAYYHEMVTQIKAVLDPSVGIYIQSITPIIQGADERFDMARIQGLNNQLAKISWELGANFVDLNEVLAGDDGFMREDYGAKDGYHLTPDGYSAWREYLITHTVYHKRHSPLYLENSNPQS